MKKLFILLTSLTLTINLFASNPILSVKEGNIDSLDILDSNGEKLTGAAQIDDFGYMIHTNDEEIVLSSIVGDLYLAPNSFVEIEGGSENPVLYLVFGEVCLNLKENLTYPITVLTPTTRSEINGKGESIFISTDQEEKFYNFSESTATRYNKITGIENEVDSMAFIDSMSKSNSVNVEKSLYKDITFIGNLFAVPNAPSLSIEREAIETIDTQEEVISRTIYFGNNEITISALNGKALIEYSKNITQDNITAALEAIIQSNPNQYKDIFFGITTPGTIEISYPKESTKDELENVLDSFIDDINIYIESLKSYIQYKTIVSTEIGNIEIVGQDGNAGIIFPEESNINKEEILERLKAIENSVFTDIAINGDTITLSYPIDSTESDFLPLRDVITTYAEKVKTTQEERVQITSAITSSEQERGFSFDIRLKTRAYTDSQKNQSLEVSLMPEFSYGAMRVAFELNPFAILDYENNTNTLDWVGYAMNFIDTFQYRSINEVFSLTIDKSTTLKGDSSGLYAGYNHLLDKYYRPLTFSMDINTKNIGMRVFYNDLTFGRFAQEGDTNALKSIGGANLQYKVSDKYPVLFSIDALFAMDRNDIHDTQIYPEFLLYIPFYSKGYNNVGLSIAIASKLDMKSKTYSPFDGGFIISASLPIEMYGFKADLGIHYTNMGDKETSGDSIHYNGIHNPNYSIQRRVDTTLLTLAGNIGYENSLFGIDLSIIGDIRTDKMSFISEYSLLDFSTYLSFAGITLKAGMSVQDFGNIENYKNSAKLYSSLDLDIGGVSTYLQVGVESIEKKQFFLSYGATASFLGKSEDRTDNPVKIPFSFEITTGYEYRFEDKTSRYLIKPAMTLGSGNYALSLRAPIQLTFNDGNFALGGWGGREWWDFGSGESGEKKVLYAITDSLQLINYINIGDPEESVAYINARRDFLMNDTLFTAFGSKDALSLRTGFNFYNLSVELYGGNVENPHIAELKIGIYPIDLKGFSIDLSIPSEFYFVDRKNFNLFFYPEIRVNVPMFWNHFNIALYGVCSISTEYVDGVPQGTKVIYDFEKNELYSALAGAEIGLKWDFFDIALQGGWRTGNLTPDMYNVFTSTYNERPSLKDSTEESLKSSFFAKATMGMNIKPFSFELAYSVNDVLALIDDYKNMNSDIFSLKARINFNDSISLYGTFHRRGFISLFQKGIDFKDDILYSPSSIYSIGMDFDYGIVSINAEYSSTLNSAGFKNNIADEKNYVNINPEYTGETISSSFSVSTRIKF